MTFLGSSCFAVLSIVSAAGVVAALDLPDPKPAGPKVAKTQRLQLSVEVEKGEEGARRIAVKDEFIFVNRTPEFTDADIKKAWAQKGPSGWEIRITFIAAAGDRLLALSKKLVASGKRLAIIVDGKAVSAPGMSMEIPGGTANITGDFSKEEAMQLASDLSQIGKGERE